MAGIRPGSLRREQVASSGGSLAGVGHRMPIHAGHLPGPCTQPHLRTLPVIDGAATGRRASLTTLSFVMQLRASHTSGGSLPDQTSELRACHRALPSVAAATGRGDVSNVMLAASCERCHVLLHERLAPVAVDASVISRSLHLFPDGLSHPPDRTPTHPVYGVIYLVDRDGDSSLLNLSELLGCTLTPIVSAKVVMPTSPHVPLALANPAFPVEVLRGTSILGGKRMTLAGNRLHPAVVPTASALLANCAGRKESLQLP